MKSLRQTRRNLYRAARWLGDLNALLSSSPRKIARRLLNKAIGRATGRLFRK